LPAKPKRHKLATTWPEKKKGGESSPCQRGARSYKRAGIGKRTGKPYLEGACKLAWKGRGKNVSVEEETPEEKKKLNETPPRSPCWMGGGKVLFTIKNLIKSQERWAANEKKPGKR